MDQIAIILFGKHEDSSSSGISRLNGKGSQIVLKLFKIFSIDLLFAKFRVYLLPSSTSSAIYLLTIKSIMLENWRRREPEDRDIIEILLQQISYSGKAFYTITKHSDKESSFDQSKSPFLFSSLCSGF
jgi:hypothetical protein